MRVISVWLLNNLNIMQAIPDSTDLKTRIRQAYASVTKETLQNVLKNPENRLSIVFRRVWVILKIYLNRKQLWFNVLKYI